ncbi:MAG: MATE family efflux transporter [Chloroflexota bacterium]
MSTTPTQLLTSLPAPKQANRREIISQIWNLALPVLLTNLLQSLVGVIDVFMVGRLGPIEIAASGMATVIRILVLVMVLSVAAGAMSLVAQAKGARDPERMSFVVRQAFSSGLILSFILVVSGLLIARPLLLFANSGGDPTAVDLGVSYLRIIFLGMPFLVINIVIDRMMQGAGDTVTPLILNGTINVLNVLFNFIFMFGIGPVPAFGLAGAAVGTVIARGLGVSIALSIILSGRNVIKIGKGSFWPDLQMFQDILGIGLPSGIQGIFRNGSRLLVISLITSTEVGTLGAAALAIGLNIESLAFMPVLGINVAATSLVGQALGAWQVEEAKRQGTLAAFLGVGVMLILTVPMIIFAPALIKFFDPSANEIVLAAGTSYMRINTPFLLSTAVAMVINGALRGAGDSMPGMYNTLISRGVIAVTLAWLFAFPLGFGSVGIWIGLAIGQCFEGIFMWSRWQMHKAWLNVALHKTDLYRKHLKTLPETIQQRYLQEIRAPLMAQPKAFEDVSADGVTYKLPDREIKVQFANNQFQLA